MHDVYPCRSGTIDDPCSGFDQCMHRGLKCIHHTISGLLRTRCLCEAKYYFDMDSYMCKRGMCNSLMNCEIAFIFIVRQTCYLNIHYKYMILD